MRDVDAAAAELVRTISMLVDCWTDLPDRDGPLPLPKDREALRLRVSGMAHSILCMLDGAAHPGPFILIPPDALEGGSIEAALDRDLAGCLHDLFAEVDRSRDG